MVRHLETFIRYYVPKGWVGSIGHFDFVPMFTEEEFKSILDGHFPDRVIYKPYIKEAINAWREQNLNK